MTWLGSQTRLSVRPAELKAHGQTETITHETVLQCSRGPTQNLRIQRWNPHTLKGECLPVVLSVVFALTVFDSLKRTLLQGNPPQQSSLQTLQHSDQAAANVACRRQEPANASLVHLPVWSDCFGFPSLCPVIARQLCIYRPAYNLM